VTRPAAAALDCNSIIYSSENGSIDHEYALINEEGIQLCEQTNNGQISTSSLFNDHKSDVVVEIND